MKPAIGSSGLSILLGCLMLHGLGSGATAQEPGERMTYFVDPAYRVIDFVDLTAMWPENPAEEWILEFIEDWAIDPKNTSIQKEVHGTNFRYLAEPEMTQDTLQTKIRAMLAGRSKAGEKVRIKNIVYEFILLEPHTPGSQNRDFGGPGQMDPETRRLQEGLISLVSGRSAALGRVDLDELLFSVYFHESWEVDPLTLQFTKKVEGITPVLWQRRQTTDAEPLDDADTGLPVYFKNTLERIQLRNP